jgi:hypothetical protein
MAFFPRAFFDPKESDQGSIFLFLRIFLPRTGSASLENAFLRRDFFASLFGPSRRRERAAAQLGQSTIGDVFALAQPESGR